MRITALTTDRRFFFKDKKSQRLANIDIPFSQETNKDHREISQAKESIMSIHYHKQLGPNRFRQIFYLHLELPGIISLG